MIYGEFGKVQRENLKRWGNWWLKFSSNSVMHALLHKESNRDKRVQRYSEGSNIEI